ncbi:MAG TPA: hypothetical protein VFX06_07305 [Stellaceae bacterium]|nr:hypothetical protein [Stellaceae bacterium]
MVAIDPPSVPVVAQPTAPAVGQKEPRFREPIRGLLAIGLVVILAAEIGFGLWFLSANCAALPERVEAVREMATIFLGPTVALVGAATGFYFGRSSV